METTSSLTPHTPPPQFRAHTKSAVRVAFKRFKRGMNPQALRKHLEDWLLKQHYQSIDNTDAIMIQGIIEALAEWTDVLER